MRKKFSLYPLCCLLFAVASAQWLEATIELPITSIPASMIANPTGTRLYVTNVNVDSSCVHIIDAVNNRLLGRIPCPDPGRLCYNTLGNKLYVPTLEGTIVVIDATADTVMGNIAVGRYPYNPCYHAARNRLYCTCGEDYTLVCIDATADTVIRRVSLSGLAGDICLNETEDKLYVSISSWGMVEVVDCAAETVTARITLPNILGPSCLSPQQNRLFCALATDSLVGVIDCAGDTAMGPGIGVGMWPFVCCHSPGTDKAYFGNYVDENVAVIDCASNSLRARIGFPSIPWSMCADPLTGNVYVTSRTSRQVLILDGFGDTVLAVVDLGDIPGTAYWGAARRRAYIAYGNRIAVLRDSPAWIAEPANAGRKVAGVGPTVVRGVLKLPEGMSPGWLLDAAGRKVAELGSGASDISRLAPGVYFVRLPAAKRRCSGSKLIVTR